MLLQGCYLYLAATVLCTMYGCKLSYATTTHRNAAQRSAARNATGTALRPRLSLCSMSSEHRLLVFFVFFFYIIGFDIPPLPFRWILHTIADPTFQMTLLALSHPPL